MYNFIYKKVHLKKGQYYEENSKNSYHDDCNHHIGS